MLLVKVEHVQEGARDLVEGSAADGSRVPVVLDEALDRTLIGQRMIDEVPLGEGRYHEEGLSRAIGAAALDSCERSPIAADARCIQLITICR